jgi:hypothetical protein
MKALRKATRTGGVMCPETTFGGPRGTLTLIIFKHHYTYDQVKSASSAVDLRTRSCPLKQSVAPTAVGLGAHAHPGAAEPIAVPNIERLPAVPLSGFRRAKTCQDLSSRHKREFQVKEKLKLRTLSPQLLQQTR